MAKLCPLNDQPVLYLDCLECEYKLECNGKETGKILEKHIDKEDLVCYTAYDMMSSPL